MELRVIFVLVSCVSLLVPPAAGGLITFHLAKGAALLGAGAAIKGALVAKGLAAGAAVAKGAALVKGAAVKGAAVAAAKGAALLAAKGAAAKGAALLATKGAVAHHALASNSKHVIRPLYAPPPVYVHKAIVPAFPPPKVAAGHVPGLWEVLNGAFSLKTSSVGRAQHAPPLPPVYK